jgi:hypothetical protein
VNLVLDAWTHVAGILSNDNHEGVTIDGIAHPTCDDNAAGATDPFNGDALEDDGKAENDPWHIDIYVSGDINACAAAYGGAGGDDTFAAVAYAHEPAAHISNPGPLLGIIDEARVWNVERTALELTACDGQALDIGLWVDNQNCDIGNSELITYHRFNEGSGHTVTDASGTLGAGGKEYPEAVLGDCPPEGFCEWPHEDDPETGWTTDTPF